MEKLLFGGSIKAKIPQNYVDVSNFRQVPDNQEVWVEEGGRNSITIDIMQRVPVTDDAGAARYHLEDIVEGGNGIRLWSSEPITMAKLPPHTIAYTTFATTHPTPQAALDHPSLPSFTGLLMLMIRLPAHETDIVITVNTPHIAGEYDVSQIDLPGGQAGPKMEHAVVVRDAIVASFEVVNYGLFGG